MQYTTLGRTGLKVSVLGLGCGGPSRLGRKTGRSEEESVAVVRRAIDAGINLLDTAESYGTEGFIAKAIAGLPRDRIVLSTKKTVSRKGVMAPPEEVSVSVEGCLSRLGTDHIDVLHMHNVRLHEYEYVSTVLVPEARKLQQAGKVRFIGITEDFEGDSSHTMLRRALGDDCWDVFMLGYNLVNQSARWTVFPEAIRKGVGTLIMYALRWARRPAEARRELVGQLIAQSRLDPSAGGGDDPLGFLVHPVGASCLVEAALRFCRYTPGVSVTLSGTGDASHAETNARLIEGPPLPVEDLARLERLFGKVDHIP
jgi:aryl-alcohol dehydrogenase-like predicted oxidoreductase